MAQLPLAVAVAVAVAAAAELRYQDSPLLVGNRTGERQDPLRLRLNPLHLRQNPLRLRRRHQH